MAWKWPRIGIFAQQRCHRALDLAGTVWWNWGAHASRVRSRSTASVRHRRVKRSDQALNKWQCLVAYSIVGQAVISFSFRRGVPTVSFEA